MKKYIAALACLLLALGLCAQSVRLKKKERRRDIELVTTEGTIVLRLSDSTPLHRDNFLSVVKSGYYDSTLFHRVIPGFMIQGGDGDSRHAAPGQPLGKGELPYTVPAEFRTSLYHRKGALAAAREGDNINPEKRSSSTQFYIVQGRPFNDASLDSIEQRRLQGRTIPPDHREIYHTTGGTPQLDGNYTVFGWVVRGLDVVDRIAALPTSRGTDRDRPLQDVRIVKARLVKRKKA